MDVRYNKARKMLIFTCDALLLQQLTRSPHSEKFKMNQNGISILSENKPNLLLV